MNRCITERLARLCGHGHLTSPQLRPAASPGLVRAVWTSACARVPARAGSAHYARLGRVSALWSSAAARVSGLSPAGGRLVSDRCKERCGLALAASWFTLLTVQSECDNVDFDLLVKNRILDPDEEQTGWERLGAMYTLDEMGGLTPELELVRGIGTAGLLVGGSLGAMLNGRLAVVKFVERNEATAFESQLAAKRALQDRVVLGMARGFFMFGWRTALFTSAFGLVSTTLMVYTNQISALHYTCAGIVSGALYKANMGLRGMTAGAVAGGLLGLIGGGVFSLACYLTDTTLPDLRYQQYLWKHQQELREKARAERKREKKRLEAEKKLEETKQEIVKTHMQEATSSAGSGADGQTQARPDQPRAGGQTQTSPDQPGASSESQADPGRTVDRPGFPSNAGSVPGAAETASPKSS